MIIPKHIECNYSKLLNDSQLNVTENTVIQRLSGKLRYSIRNLTDNDSLVPFKYNYSKEYGQTIVTDFNLFCDLTQVLKMPRFANFFGFVIGALLLGFASDKGGRKIIILACIWTAGVMSNKNTLYLIYLLLTFL